MMHLYIATLNAYHELKQFIGMNSISGLSNKTQRQNDRLIIMIYRLKYIKSSNDKNVTTKIHKTD